MAKIVAQPVSSSKHYGSFYDTASAQSAASVNIGYAMSCNSTLANFGVTMDSSSITISNAGVYNIQFSTQFVGNKTANIEVWLRGNGQDYPWTNTKLSTSNQMPNMFAAWNFVQNFNSNDVVQLMWAVDDTAIKIQSTASTAHSPAVPGVIITVTEV